MSFLRRCAAVAGKDLAIELRSRELSSGMLLFAVLTLVVFQFAFHFVPPPPHGAAGPLGPADAPLSGRQLLFMDLGAGVLWTIFLLAGLLGLARSFGLERENGCLEGLLLAPGDRAAILLGKLAANLVLLLSMEGIVLALAGLLFQAPLLKALPALATIAAVNTFGLATMGTVLSLVCSRARGGETLLLVLQIPLSLPILIYAVGATGRVLSGARLGEVSGELGVSAGASAIYFGVALLFFDRVLED